MSTEPILIRKKWNIDLLVGSGFTPLTGIQTSHFSFLAEKNDPNIELLLDLSKNESDEYFDFVNNSEGFKYLSISDLDGMITKDLLTFIKTITELELKNIQYKMNVILNAEKTIESPADIMYQNELFICKKGIIPSVLKGN